MKKAFSLTRGHETGDEFISLVKSIITHYEEATGAKFKVFYFSDDKMIDHADVWFVYDE